MATPVTDDGKFSAGTWTCLECGALIADSARTRHKKWHEALIKALLQIDGGGFGD